jgi:acetate---CoA ligase (ADP-forming) subunit alpha
VPASIVLEILNGSVENIKGAIIVSSGFREIGSEGQEMEARLKKLERRRGSGL